MYEFALKWTPFGRAPAEEIFERFGMKPARFMNRLWQMVDDGHIGADLVKNFAGAFPRPPQFPIRKSPVRPRDPGSPMPPS